MYVCGRIILIIRLNNMSRCTAQLVIVSSEEYWPVEAVSPTEPHSGHQESSCNMCQSRSFVVYIIFILGSAWDNRDNNTINRINYVYTCEHFSTVCTLHETVFQQSEEGYAICLKEIKDQFINNLHLMIAHVDVFNHTKV